MDCWSSPASGSSAAAWARVPQFPLHVWLPDAMEGPTPVSALVHSATMVAAGVYLVGRFYPVFTPEVLLVIAVIGTITLFMAATIALTATDIKRVLAYSTVSQLGYMMLALGVGGWLAGMMHLVTHAFFKSLLFLCSGSVIHAVHSNEMTVMGGLRKKMPITSLTMLIGCLAIAGMGIPFVLGLEWLLLEGHDPGAGVFLCPQRTRPAWGSVFFVAAAGGAAMTAFYMFRLWFLTFAGTPRDAHRYEHAHESPRVMTIPLVILAVFAMSVAWPTPSGLPSLKGLLEQARPAGTDVTVAGCVVRVHVAGGAFVAPAGNYRSIMVPVTLLAFCTAVAGIASGDGHVPVRRLNPDDVSRQFAGIYRFLKNKWWFDELYDVAVVCGRCTTYRRLVCRLRSAVDRRFIDGHGACDHAVRVVVGVVGGPDLSLTASWIAWPQRPIGLGVSLRVLQTGSLRQYVLFLVVGVIAVFLISSLF